MKNAFSRIGRTCASVVIGGGLMAGALLAASESKVTVNLPHEVTVGSTTLPSGEYTISNLDMAGKESFFVIRSASTPTLTLQAQKITDADDQDRTSVVLSKDGDVWHLEKMFLRGESTGYQFVNTK